MIANLKLLIKVYGFPHFACWKWSFFGKGVKKFLLSRNLTKIKILYLSVRKCMKMMYFQEHPLQIKNRGGDYVSTGDHCQYHHHHHHQHHHHHHHHLTITCLMIIWLSARVSEDSLLVLIANALPHWLLQGTKVDHQYNHENTNTIQIHKYNTDTQIQV